MCFYIYMRWCNKSSYCTFVSLFAYGCVHVYVHPEVPPALRWVLIWPLGVQRAALRVQLCL